MYRAMGGESADPTVPYAVTQTRGVLVDNQRILQLLGALPRPVASYGQALIDHRMRYAFHKPERDGLTQAPMATTFFIDPGHVDDFYHPRSPLRGLLEAMSRSFLDAVQSKRMLRERSGLTQRQTEALTLAARGFTVAETAEHMGVSRRSAEKTLAAARTQLGASTTAAAVYRAMVYRAVG
jgi:DNA-binding CsgD family transcriptional regulator